MYLTCSSPHQYLHVSSISRISRRRLSHSWIVCTVSRCWCCELPYVVVCRLAIALNEPRRNIINLQTIEFSRICKPTYSTASSYESAQPKRRKEPWKRFLAYDSRWRLLNYFISSPFLVADQLFDPKFDAVPYCNDRNGKWWWII